MNGIQPVVRHLILCEDVLTGPANPNRVHLLGLISSISSLEDPPYPTVVPELRVFIQLTECRGTGILRIDILQEDSGLVVFRTRPRTVRFNVAPLDVVGIPWRLVDCPFAEAGMYQVRLWYDNAVLAHQPLRMR